jgi:hypothetical protein
MLTAGRATTRKGGVDKRLDSTTESESTTRKETVNRSDEKKITVDSFSKSFEV